MGQTCGSELPCCAKNNSTSGDIVKARPVEYGAAEAAEDKLAKGEVPEWNGAALKGSGEDYGSSKKGAAAGEAYTAAATSCEGVDGEETYEDGSTFKGQLADGRRHGYGVWTSPAEQYTGQWRFDQRDGEGRQTWQDGRAYDGQFKQGKFHGVGRMEWHTPNGLMLYEGQYVDDLKHGVGKYVWPDNRMYEGEWKDGQRSGKATYTNSQGQSRAGIWKDDKVVSWLDDEPPPH
eukprot:TRINITY_DN111996_c0_g1_i1.p1 TRINITY_DN111996_c0_g1~~TRINITY_DN111996_c0_g1_i1.p1  ORF type:complete len:261 (+),score=49.01 TRINITY_DN111996_c0_g1_i1:85-783(+)